MSKRVRLAVMAFNTPSAFVPGGTQDVGGIETQYRALLDHWRDSMEVTLIGKRPEAATRFPSGLAFHPIVPETHGSKAIRFIKNARQTIRAIVEAHPEVIVQAGTGAATFFAWLASRRLRVPFVFHWASDSDADGSLLDGSRFLQVLAVFARRRARVQVCQTEDQLAMLGDRERANALILPNVVADNISAPDEPGHQVLWLANIRAVKRVDRFIDLARALPHRRFRMVGAMLEGREFQESVRHAIASCPNIEYDGAVPNEQLPAILRQARCLVNTSDVEGFPATFLEACAAGVPVVSLRFDPGQMLSKDGAGVFLNGDGAGLPDAVEAMFDPGRTGQFRAACQAVAGRHSAAVVATQWQRLLKRVAQRR